MEIIFFFLMYGVLNYNHKPLELLQDKLTLLEGHQEDQPHEQHWGDLSFSSFCLETLHTFVHLA